MVSKGCKNTAERAPLAAPSANCLRLVPFGAIVVSAPAVGRPPIVRAYNQSFRRRKTDTETAERQLESPHIHATRRRPRRWVCILARAMPTFHLALIPSFGASWGFKVNLKRDDARQGIEITLVYSPSRFGRGLLSIENTVLLRA